MALVEGSATFVKSPNGWLTRFLVVVVLGQTACGWALSVNRAMFVSRRHASTGGGSLTLNRALHTE